MKERSKIILAVIIDLTQIVLKNCREEIAAKANIPGSVLTLFHAIYMREILSGYLAVPLQLVRRGIQEYIQHFHPSPLIQFQMSRTSKKAGQVCYRTCAGEQTIDRQMLVSITLTLVDRNWAGGRFGVAIQLLAKNCFKIILQSNFWLKMASKLSSNPTFG